ncbi:MAG: CHAT domain-containing protein [Acidobacteriota bacterium]
MCFFKKIVLLLSFSVFLCLDLFPVKTLNNSEPKPEVLYSECFSSGEKAQIRGDFDKSLEYYEKSLSIAQNLKSWEKELHSLEKIALMLWNKEEYEKSAQKYKAALTLAIKNQNKNKQNQLETLLSIHNLYIEGIKQQKSGSLQRSIESLTKAVSLSRENGFKEHELKCLRNLSNSYFDSNDLLKFKELSEQALEMAKNLNHKKEIGKCSNNLGIYHRKNKNYSQALHYIEEALFIAKGFNDQIEIANCANNIGIIYKNIGFYDKALDYLNQALEIDRELDDELYIAIDLLGIGTVYRNMGLSTKDKSYFEKALSRFKECLKISKKIKDIKNEVYVLNNIGSVYSDLHEYFGEESHFQKAQLTFKEALTKAEKLNDKESIGMILNNLGIIHSNQGNYDEATRYFQKAINMALNLEGGKILWEAYLELAQVCRKQNKIKQAGKYFNRSISIIEDIRSNIKLEELKASYLGTNKRMEPYHGLIHILFSLHQKEPEKNHDTEAFNYAERAKARAFLDRLESSQVNISQYLDFKLQNQEKELMKDISRINQKLLDSGLTSQESLNLHEELKQKEDEWETLKRKIRNTNPAYANLRYPEIISLEEAQKMLDQKTAFFEYLISEENSYLFVVTHKSLNIFPLPNKEQIHDLVSNYLKKISDKENNEFSEGYSLFRTLVQPGLKKSMKKIIFIPDDILNFLPFESLITQPDSRKWLVWDYHIAYSPSISSLQEIINRKKRNGYKRHKDLLAVGDPYFKPLKNGSGDRPALSQFSTISQFDLQRLEYSGTEIDKISRLFRNSQKTVFKRNQATEDVLKKANLEDYKIIHLATHSLIDNQRPFRSSIVLALDNNPQEDGFLQMREIYNIKLNSDLVVLSACKTGLGQFIKGEGIEGINRSFFYAGSSAVLMSLWPVNDQATFQLMERFYAHLRSSKSIIDSLRKTKLELIDSDSLSHPYYWAGFIVSGKADQKIFHPFSLQTFMIGMIFFVFITLFLFFYFKHRKIH